MLGFLKKKVIGDMMLNIFAVSLPIVTLQLIVYPYLSKVLSEEIYGLMLTFYSFWFVISNSLGNVLNNIRLLNVSEYQESNIKGDFNRLLIRYLGINFLLIILLTIMYTGKLDVLEVMLSLLISSILLMKSYIEVGFRINLSYTDILIHNILQSIGFLVGLLLVRYVGIWQLLYLCGFSFSLIYSILKTDLLKEPFIKTKFYRNVKRQADIYSIANFSCSSISYIDKLLLYPLMGGEAVSIYYTATIMGKMISMVSGPITSVILSYISKWEKGKRKIFTKVLCVGGIISVFGYFITMLASGPVINLLFPQWASEVMFFLPVTTIAVLVQTLNSFLDPFVLKFYDIKWQIVINVSSIIVYVISALIMWNTYGLMGFCVGTILGNATKTMIMCTLHFSHELKKKL